MNLRVFLDGGVEFVRRLQQTKRQADGVAPRKVKTPLPTAVETPPLRRRSWRERWLRLPFTVVPRGQEAALFEARRGRF